MMERPLYDGTTVADLRSFHIREETTALGGVELNIGFRRVAREHFKHPAATALEIENAIAAVEDEIARAKPRRGVRPITRDAMVLEIALAAGLARTTAMVLSRDAVEAAFERAIRRPPDHERMAALLILRELMHHLDIPSVEVQAP